MNNIFTVSLDDSGQNYTIHVAENMSVNEVIFAMAVAIKCFVRDGIVDNKETLLELLNNYLTDQQYDEIKENKNESN